MTAPRKRDCDCDGWTTLVRENLSALDLPHDAREAVIAELAAHLEDSEDADESAEISWRRLKHAVQLISACTDAIQPAAGVSHPLEFWVGAHALPGLDFRASVFRSAGSVLVPPSRRHPHRARHCRSVSCDCDVWIVGVGDPRQRSRPTQYFCAPAFALLRAGDLPVGGASHYGPVIGRGADPEGTEAGRSVNLLVTRVRAATSLPAARILSAWPSLRRRKTFPTASR
jgi:hypothetical protein